MTVRHVRPNKDIIRVFTDLQNLEEQLWLKYTTYTYPVHTNTHMHKYIPSTVRVARAIRTGIVKMEQVYSPSSDNCTLEMVIDSSVGVLL